MLWEEKNWINLVMTFGIKLLRILIIRNILFFKRNQRRLILEKKNCNDERVNGEIYRQYQILHDVEKSRI